MALFMETMFPYKNNFNRAGNSTTKIDEIFEYFEVYLPFKVSRGGKLRTYFLLLEKQCGEKCFIFIFLKIFFFIPEQSFIWYVLKRITNKTLF